MEILNLIQRLKDNNININLLDSNLEISHEGETLSDELYNDIKNNKARIITFLKENESDFQSLKKADSYESVTPFQKGLISYVKNNPEGKRYILQVIYQLNETISYSLFTESCRILISRHEILRTCYDFDDTTGRFTTKLLTPDNFVCEEFDLQDSNPDSLLALLNQIKEQPFDISKESLIRFSLIKQNNSVTSVAITVHHLIVDGNSIPLLSQELVMIFNQLKINEKPYETLPEKLQFSNYAKWIAKQNVARSEFYWKEKLKDAHPVLIESQTVGENKDASVIFNELRLDYILNKSAIDLIKSNGISLSAAFNFLLGFVLSEYYGESKFVWGNMVTLRPPDLSEMEVIVGPCISTIPVVMDFNVQSPVLNLMKALQLQVLESREHAHLLLNDIFSLVKQNNLFSVLFTFQNFQNHAIGNQDKIGNAQIIDTEKSITSHFPLTIMFYEKDGKLSSTVSYRQDQFSSYLVKDIIETVISSFNGLSEIIDSNCSALNILSHFKTDNIALLKGDVTQRIDNEKNLVKDFAKTVNLFPENIAVKDIDGKYYSYRELDLMSNFIAHELTQNNIRGVVGVRLDHSVRLIASIIGVLKAGCQVVSLESEWPDEKLIWMVESNNIVSSISDPKDFFVERLKKSFNLVLPDKIPLVNQYSHNQLIRAEDVCAINYTSGSTGEPKMILTTHVNHLNRINWLKSQYPAITDDIYCFKTLLSFAPSIREIFEPLLQGATVCVFPKYANQDLEVFQEFIIKNKITRLFLTPTFLQLLIENEKISCMQGLNYLEISGEPITNQLAEKIHKKLPDVKILNRYGSTECASVVYHQLNTNDKRAKDKILPLGKPICNTNIYVVDSEMKVRPRGVVGEILIESDCLAKGYSNINQQENVFFKNLFKDGDTILRTGDLGFINEFGQLCYQGRKTRMIKVRGFRVEPGEIEYNLEQHPNISKAVVLSIENGLSYRIVALCIAKDADADKQISANLKGFLKERIPSYMLPHEIKFIEKIPVTTNGKIDMLALKQLITEDGSGEFYPPFTVTEKVLYKIITSLLPDSRIDSKTDFFDMGMDSILNLKITYEIKKKTGIRISGPHIFEYNNIQKLSSYIDRVIASEDEEEEGDYYRLNYQEDNDDVLFLIPPLDATSLIYIALKPYIPEYLTVVVFDAFDLNKNKEQGSTMEKMAAFYTERIQKMYKNKTVHLAGWSFGATITYAVATQVQRLGIEVRSLVLIDPGFNTSNYDDDITREKLVDIMNKLLIQGGINPEMEEDITEQMYAANQLIKYYTPQTFDGDIALIKPEMVSSFERNYGKKYNGLENYCTGVITLSSIPGNHMTMMKGSLTSLSNAIFGNLKINV